MGETRLAGLYVYPVKSCAGIRLDQAEVDELGLAWDRRWMVVNAGREFLTQRMHPRLALVRPRIVDGVLRLAAPGMPELAVAPATGAGTAEERLRVRVWKDDVDVVPAGREADDWFSAHLGVRCRLVHMPRSARRAVEGPWDELGHRVSLADGYPFLLIGRASLEDLNRRLAEPLPMDRFRPNLVVEGTDPFAEDGWREFHVGGIRFTVAKPCLRCVITTIDQATARGGKEPLRTLATYRRVAGTNEVAFGQNLVHSGRGVLRVGDSIDPRVDFADRRSTHG